MAILFVCNVNNHFFSTVRHLRAAGLDAHLLTLGFEDKIFAPAADAYDWSFDGFVRNAEWGEPADFSATDFRRVERDVAGFDVIFACGTAPAYLNEIGRRVDVFIPYGSDLIEMPRLHLRRFRRDAVASLWRFPRAQMRGIRSASYCLGAIAPQFEQELARIGFTGKRELVAIPPLYAEEFHPDRISAFYDRSCWAAEFASVRADADVMVFHHARHIWATAYRNSPYSQKGNDKLIRAFARTVKACPTVRFRLAMFEYGPDVGASKALVEQLGIRDQVAWFPSMARKEIMIGIHMSDISCGEFTNSWLFGGTIIEGLAMAKPLMSYRDDAMYDGVYPDLYPLMNGGDEETLFRLLRDYVDRPDHYRAVGRTAYAWFRKHIIDDSVHQLASLVERIERSS